MFIRGRGFGAYGAATNDPAWPYAPVSSGDCGCGGSCGGCGDHHGMGLFDSMDPTTWGAGEYLVAGGIGYVAVKLMGDAQKVGRRARRSPKSSLGVVGLVALAGGAYYLWQKAQASSTGVGDYMSQKYVNPQILQMPLQSAAIRIPAGW